MADRTSIEWTDATVNAVNGCSVLSPGCTNCYAMRLAGTRMKHHPTREGLTLDSKAGPVWTGETRLSETALLQPLRWRRPRRIFWNAHGDLFHPNVPDAWIDRVFAVCALTPQHTHQILTKRPERMRDCLTAFEDRPDAFGKALASVARTAGLPKQAGLDAIDDMLWPLPNVWLGTSVEDQTRADERIPILMATPAAVRFLSCEPLLGPIDLTDITGAEKSRDYGSPVHGWSAIWRNNGIGRTWIDWVIVGGESGPGARPMHPDWARSLRDQCAAAGVPFFFKQWGEWLPGLDWPENAPGPSLPWLAWVDGRWGDYQGGSLGDTVVRVGKKRAGRLLDGQIHDGMPA